MGIKKISNLFRQISDVGLLVMAGSAAGSAVSTFGLMGADMAGAPMSVKGAFYAAGMGLGALGVLGAVTGIGFGIASEAPKPRNG